MVPKAANPHGTCGTLAGMDVAERLRTLGYRLTPQRRLVWEALRTADRHLPAEEIHARVVRSSPDLNLASVYRTLTLLGELGLARQVHIGDGRGHWELAHPDDEFHLVCRTCGRVAHHEGTLVEEVRAHLSDHHGFAPDHVELVVHGVCGDCASAG